MKPIFRNSSVITLLAAGLLSACSPNPAVLQDRVYGSTRPVAPAPVAAPSTVTAAPVAQPKTGKNTSSKQATPPPEMADKPQEGVEVLEVPKAYQTSPAVQALMKQADTEMGRGNLDNAATIIERALRIESDNPDLWMKLSQINDKQGNHEQAVSMANKAQSFRE